MINISPKKCLLSVIVASIILISSISISDNSYAVSGDPVHQAFPQEIILIDAGHGGIDGGTTFQNIVEKDLNLIIAKKVFMLLRSKGYDAILNRSGDYALSDDNHWLNNSSRHLRDLAQRKELSRSIPTQIVVSLHVNWGQRSNKRGPLVLHQNEGRSFLLANIIQQQMNPLYDTHQQPVYGRPYYILNYVQDPAVIVEMGFLSNAEDRAMLCNSRKQLAIAEAIVAGIISYLTVS
ncbi:N-acetylmuramoyl-L-alanine amidase [Paenibacillus crassostreae]|uniref:N-acetylmuramoyl-L-alanine amidase n=1 Tax=Paenibacillus crassostreae TaxID=1763538 RepID=A0A167FVY6_9BACL|nr:N-acetylmuramoyl-L-alanine amidase [Paenibacillus crassostreae]AOZ94007.1 N-acetylmuramoyl-L-alanine amidase [Paenibacillus crassostreae]OAB76958.1 N-acetylmuramoyl-L-alanine amidase [Paenibacillus crassostreae]